MTARKLTHAAMQDIQAMWSGGNTHQAIADKYGVNRRTIQRWLTERGTEPLEMYRPRILARVPPMNFFPDNLEVRD